MNAIVEEFLKDNYVKRGWRKLILRSNDLTQKLGKIIEELHKSPCSYAPEYGKILNAFSYAEPDDIKVVIIGTSPVPQQSAANGLAFSSDKHENEIYYLAAIPKVHDALRDANILRPNEKKYYCGHQEWAKNGVLLLNAALTITKENGGSDDIKTHCDRWEEFLQDLLCEWISKTRISHKLFVMRWGCPNPNCGYVNYAENVWKKAHERAQDKSNVRTFNVIHHPTFPKTQGNNFSSKAPEHFKEINTHYNNIFDIPVTPDDSDDSDSDEVTSSMRKLGLK